MSQLVRWGFDRASGAKARPVPLVRAVAYRGPLPIHSHRTMAEVMADEQAVVLAAKKEAGPRIKSGVTKAKADPVGAALPLPVSAPVAVAVPPVPSPPPTREPILTCGEGGRGQSDPPLTQQGPATTRQPKRVATGNVAKQDASPEPTVALAGRTLKISPQLLCTPKPVPAPALPRDARGKIILAAAPSGMESAAQQWAAPPSPTISVAPMPDEAGKVWCAGCDANVPRWFGRDCISTTCELKASA